MINYKTPALALCLLLLAAQNCLSQTPVGSFANLSDLIRINASNNLVLSDNLNGGAGTAAACPAGICPAPAGAQNTIDGAGFYIDGNTRTLSGFNLAANNALTLSNITLQNFASTGLGGALSGGTDLIFYNTTFTGNTAVTGGGAVYAAAGSALNFYESAAFKANSSVSALQDNNGRGGAVSAEGAIGGSELAAINFNSAVTFGGASTEDGNRGSLGGAVYAINGNVSFASAQTLFQNNTANYGGGAIHSDINSTFIFEQGASFIANSATGTQGGGAVFISNGNVIIIGPSTFTGNTSNGGGAAYVANGIFTANGGSFNNNTAATANGGALVAESSLNVTLTDMDFINNSALNGLGGAFYIFGADLLTPA
ncbi:MAG: hypothetical protein LBR90_00865, partial [Elusimicrobiota bacterium]|nr:hypothetical protein [Elusimicrobiota bacterium]